MTRRFPYSMIPDSTGDKALAACNRLKLDILHLPAGDGEPAEVHCNFQLHGSFDLLAADSGQLLRSLVHTFKTPRAGEEGGAQ